MKKNSKQIFFNRTLATTVMVSSQILLPTIVSASSFSDVKSTDYFSEYVAQLVDRDIIHGYLDGKFRPHQPITRGEAVKIISKLVDLDTTTITNSKFTDVSENHIFYKEITALAEAKLISGYGDGTFQPEKFISRYEIAILLSNVFQLTSQNTEPLPFTDINPKFQHFIAALYENYITSGISQKTYGGLQFVTRGQFAKFVILAENASKINDPIKEDSKDTPYEPPTALVITGIKDGEYYNQDVKILFNVGVSYLKKDNDPEIIISNGTTITDDGEYVFTNNYLSDKTIIRFVIDKIAPIISGVTEGAYYKQQVSPVFNEGLATLSKDGGTFEPFISGTDIHEDGHYLIKVVDNAGNVSTIQFVIDQTAPIVSGVVDGEIRNSSFTPTFNEGAGRLSKNTGEFNDFTSGSIVSEEGNYTLEVEDAAGNVTTVQFTIDKTAPIITAVEEGKHYQSVTPAFNEGTAILTKDGGVATAFVSGTELKENGQYSLEVTDAAGNSTRVQFTVDNQAPVISGVVDGEIRNSSFTPTFNEGHGRISKNNGEFNEFTSGSTVSEEGNYTLEVEDAAGNKTTVRFTIDKTVPLISGVENGKHYQSVVPAFNEGTALLTKDGGVATDFVSGTKLTENGQYSLEVTDAAGNKTTVQFTVDNISPVISGVIDGEIRNSQFSLTFNEGTGQISKNGGEFVSFTTGTVVDQEGQYTLAVQDEAGNKTTVQFTIDKTAPIITAVEESKYYQSVAPVFNEGTALLTKDGGEATVFVSGTELTENGQYTLEVTDEAENKTTVQFTVDNQVPVISGVVDGEIRNSPFTPTFNEGTGQISKNGGEFTEFTSGSTVSEEGNYTLEVEDAAGNKTTVQFTIDKTAPIITAVEEGKHYQSVAPAFNEGTAILTKDGGTGTAFVSGTEVTENGQYTLEVTDEAGNKTTVQFTVDNTEPVISGVVDGEIRNSPFTPTFNEGTGQISKNGGEFTEFTSGSTVSEEGNYTLEVEDAAGNKTTVQFMIDKTAPIITAVEEGKHYQSVAPAFNEGTAILTKDGGVATSFVSGTELKENGQYSLEVTDAAGNKTTVQFTVDNISPVISGVMDGEIRNSQFSPTFNEGTGRISKNGGEFNDFTSGSTVSEEGNYTLEVEDAAGNKTTVQFTIDKTAPIISAVEEGKHYQNVAPAFNEGTAILTKDGGTGKAFVSGTRLTENGQYTLEVTDAAGNSTSVQFTVDNQVPVISGVVDGEIRNSSFTPTFNEGKGRISKNNGEFNEFTTGSTVSEEGNYTLEVEDAAGNVTTVHFKIDLTDPIISGVENGKHYQSATPAFNEGTAILTKDGGTGKAFVSGTRLTENGQYTLEVTDEVGNKTTVTFTIDNVPPEITGKQNDSIFNLEKTYTDKELTVQFNEGTAKLSKNNGSFIVIENNHLVEEDGVYVLEVTDLAGNKTVASFVIDRTPPIINGVENGMSYQRATPTFSEAIAKLIFNGGEEQDFVSGTEIVEEGEYVLKVMDPLLRETSVGFKIDHTAPLLVSANLTTPSGLEPTKAGINDVVTLLVTANESVTISDVVGEIGGTVVSKANVDDLGDNDPNTYAININISEQGMVNGAVSLEFKMTDVAGNSITINTEELSGIGNVDVDTVTPLMQSSSVMADEYVDIKFSEPVYGGDKNALGPLEASDFNAVLSKVGGNYNPLTATVSHITAIDGSPLVGGETEVRVYLTYSGAKIQGDKLEIKPVAEAILDHVGNATSIIETSGLKSLTPLVTYEWNESSTKDMLVITSNNLNMSTYTNVILRLAGDRKGDAEVFLTTPTRIGGDDQILISVSPGWDNGGAYFGSTANGVFAQAVGRNTIQFTANTQYAPYFIQDHFYIILQDINDPSIMTIIDLNIDSYRTNNIIWNNN